jgi:hypothetical protein
MCQDVLKRNQINKIDLFPNTLNTDSFGVKTIKYLGIVNTTKKRNFKILTYSFNGTRLRTGCIYIYDIANHYVGKYELGDVTDLPDKLDKNNLVFTNKDNSDCDKHLVTRISFRHGLPKQIFLKCKEAFGDIYSFSSDSD